MRGVRSECVGMMKREYEYYMSSEGLNSLSPSLTPATSVHFSGS